MLPGIALPLHGEGGEEAAALAREAASGNGPLSVLLLCSGNDRKPVSGMLQRSGLLVAQRWSTRVAAVVCAPNRRSLKDAMHRQLQAYNRRDLRIVDFDVLQGFLYEGSSYDGSQSKGSCCSSAASENSDQVVEGMLMDYPETSGTTSQSEPQQPQQPQQSPSFPQSEVVNEHTVLTSHVWDFAALAQWSDPRFEHSQILQARAPKGRGGGAVGGR